jgi:succinoglycan biosynthesis protein ExoA
MKLSVLIVTCGRLELFKQCCESVARALPESAEAIVIVNGGHGPTRQWLSQWGHPKFRGVLTSAEPRAVARNRAFHLCRGEILYFLDDDVRVPQHLFHEALSVFSQSPELIVLGGPNLTPPESPWREQVFGAIMSSSFAAPLVRARYGSQAFERAACEHDLILCNLAFRRSGIPDDLRFKDTLSSNEENLFLYECRRRNLAARYRPGLYVFHRRRPTWKKFLAQIYTYGLGRAEQTWEAPRSAHAAFFVPALACLTAVVLVCLGETGWLIRLTLVHFLLSLGAALGSPVLRRLGIKALALAVPMTALVHLAYGLGVWRGGLKRLLSGTPLIEVQPPVIESHQSFDVV